MTEEHIGKPYGRNASLAWIAAAYGASALAAAPAFARFGAASPAKALAAAYFAGALVTFGFSRGLNNSSVFDAFWSVAPMIAAPVLAVVGLGAAPEARPPAARVVVVVALVLAWGARLTFNWYRGWTGLSHEDWRYVDLRKKTGPLYWAVSLFGLHLMPTWSIYLGSLSLVAALVTGRAPLNVFDLAGLAVTALAVGLETVADRQLHDFRASKPAAGAMMEQGLWAHSRHPNYLGEMLFWWGLFFFSLAAQGSLSLASLWPYVTGPLWITGLFVFASIPMIEKRSVERRPAYRELMQRVPMVVPWKWLLGRKRG